MPSKARYRSQEQLSALIAKARGTSPVDLVLRGAQWLDVFSGTFRSGDVAIHDGVIVGVGETYEGREVEDVSGSFIVPGWIDSHVHIESSLMTPPRFQEMVLPCGTTTAIWDPHEIANVWGQDGIRWALESSQGLDLDLFVMVPSCVPSTTPSLGLETSGASLKMQDIWEFVGHERVLGLAEMMNFPGLLGGEPDVLAKLQGFSGLRRDGHCPGLLGKDLNAYGVAGIHSCHESTTLAEAQEKLAKGIHVLIREGSCAKDAEALLPILTPFSSACVGLCSDDRNPLDVSHEGHIGYIVERGLQRGISPEVMFRSASYAPAKLYGLDDRGAVAPGYKADLVVVAPRQGRDWGSGLHIGPVYKSGLPVNRTKLTRQAEDLSKKERSSPQFANRGPNLHLGAVNFDTFRVPSSPVERVSVRVIGVIPGQLLTETLEASLVVKNGNVLPDPQQDVIKIAVLERHHGSGGRATGFVKGFGLRHAAIATSINHDCHNVIVVGPREDLMADAVNLLREIDGGIVVVHEDGRTESLPLPIGGLMTDVAPESVTQSLVRLKALTREGGCPLVEPFLQLSFLALPVIPALKITDKGLVDVFASKLIPVL